MTYACAAEEVLKRHSPSTPLHYRRITELAIQDGLISPGGATPEASMNAAISVEIQKRTEANTPQRLVRGGKGLYGLATPAEPP
jgi:HB1, ASXL, restriction endonuclease HTH domain